MSYQNTYKAPTTYSSNRFGRVCITHLTAEEANLLKIKIGNFMPKRLWINSGSDGYWATDPTKGNPGEGHWWSSGVINPGAKVEPYDGMFAVTYAEPFKEEVNLIHKH